jgi:glycosyltransferase involved in cell wall biosynthesis
LRKNDLGVKLEDCRAAVVHHWLLSMTGGEKVCEAVCEMLGSPDVFCLLAQPSRLSTGLTRCAITTSFVQKLPLSFTHYRYYAWLFPLAVESFDLRPYDLVITSDANTMKGVITRPETCHICYCHSPMRYAWNMFQDYVQELGRVKGLAMALVMHYLRLWDYAAAARVDHFVANSRTVRNRIRKYYRRDATIIHPPVDVDRFQEAGTCGDYYLCLSRLVGYKRIDVAVDAFSQNGRHLVVVGKGPEAENLKARAAKNVEFVGAVSDAERDALYLGCKAFVFPGEEDFGIVMAEAQAAGKPVIAYGKGGATEIVVPDRTGLWFMEQTPHALNAAIAGFERREDSFAPDAIRAHSRRFCRERFEREFGDFVQNCWDTHHTRVQQDEGAPVSCEAG